MIVLTRNAVLIFVKHGTGVVLTRFYKILATVMLLLVIAVVMPSVRGEQDSLATAAAAERPNIVYIVTDDQETAMIRHMPRVQRYLVREGVKFERAYVNLPTCCPSRATVLRGQYAHNHNVKSNLWPTGGFKRFMAEGYNKENLAIWMRRSGYTTGLSGKYFNEYDHRWIPRGWDDWHAHVGSIAGFRMNHNGQIADHSGKVDTLDTVISRRALGFIDREAPKRKPFFLYVSTIAPHGPAHHAERHRSLFKKTPLPRPPSFERDAFSNEKIRDMTVFYRKRLRSVQTVDEMVRQVVLKLRKHGELKNTYIVFTSDNGYHMGQHGLNPGKGMFYEEDIRVPLIVRGPGVQRGVGKNELAVNADLAPTFLDMAGSRAPSWVDGRSLMPVLGGSPEVWRTALPIEQFRKGRGDKRNYRAIRTDDDLLYVRYKSGRHLLYDMKNDPYQLENIAGKRPEIEAELKKRLDELNDCRGQSCRVAENRG